MSRSGSSNRRCARSPAGGSGVRVAAAAGAGARIFDVTDDAFSRFYGHAPVRPLARYLRELGLAERTTHERLVRVCFNDYDREIALVAERATSSAEREVLTTTTGMWRSAGSALISARTRRCAPVRGRGRRWRSSRV